jgi:hypothetical protein
MSTALRRFVPTGFIRMPRMPARLKVIGDRTGSLTVCSSAAGPGITSITPTRVIGKASTTGSTGPLQSELRVLAYLDFVATSLAPDEDSAAMLHVLSAGVGPEGEAPASPAVAASMAAIQVSPDERPAAELCLTAAIESAEGVRFAEEARYRMPAASRAAGNRTVAAVSRRVVVEVAVDCVAEEESVAAAHMAVELKAERVVS